MEGVRKLESEVADTLELIGLAEADGDAAMADEGMAALRALAEEAKRREIESLLAGEADANDAYVEINAGTGGTEAQDWAEMLMRMYMRWAEQHGYKVQLLEQSEGEQAGIKSATLQVSGPNAYGWLKTEAGVHRLVRISPFDSAARRHTSFASVWVYPVVDDNIDIAINESDLKVDTYRASGAGGQHVNKTESAIRITHVPSGIIVACQTDRSQHRNRAMAMAMLKARLYEAELQKREAAAAAAGECQDRYRLGASDPQLRAGAVSAGEGPAHRGGEGQSGRGAGWRSGRVHGGGTGRARRCDAQRGQRAGAVDLTLSCSQFLPRNQKIRAGICRSGYRICLPPRTPYRSVGTGDTHSGRTYHGSPIVITAPKYLPREPKWRDPNPDGRSHGFSATCPSAEQEERSASFSEKLSTKIAELPGDLKRRPGGGFTLAFLICSRQRPRIARATPGMNVPVPPPDAGFHRSIPFPTE